MFTVGQQVTGEFAGTPFTGTIYAMRTVPGATIVYVALDKEICVNNWVNAVPVWVTPDGAPFYPHSFVKPA